MTLKDILVAAEKKLSIDAELKEKQVNVKVKIKIKKSIKFIRFMKLRELMQKIFFYDNVLKSGLNFAIGNHN